MGTRPVRDRQPIQRNGETRGPLSADGESDGVATKGSRHPVPFPGTGGRLSAMSASGGISFTAIIAAVVIPVVAVVGSIIAGIVLVFA